MSDTDLDIRVAISDCFNANSLNTEVKSGYQLLSALMLKDYDLTHDDVDEVVGDIEQMVAQYIMENSPKFTDDEEH